MRSNVAAPGAGWLDPAPEHPPKEITQRPTERSFTQEDYPKYTTARDVRQTFGLEGEVLAAYLHAAGLLPLAGALGRRRSGWLAGKR